MAVPLTTAPRLHQHVGGPSPAAARAQQRRSGTNRALLTHARPVPLPLEVLPAGRHRPPGNLDLGRDLLNNLPFKSLPK